MRNFIKTLDGWYINLNQIKKLYISGDFSIKATTLNEELIDIQDTSINYKLAQNELDLLAEKL